MIFKQQTALLPPRLLTETPKTVCLRLTSEVYSSQRSRHSTSGSGFYDPLRRGHKSQRNGETHSPERCPAAKPVSKTPSQSRVDRCATCRVFGHVATNCRNSHLPGCNRSTIPWVQSHIMLLSCWLIVDLCSLKITFTGVIIIIEVFPPTWFTHRYSPSCGTLFRPTDIRSTTQTSPLRE